MRRRLILVISADLDKKDGEVVVGPETELVCKRAYALWQQDRSARVYVSAGNSPNHNHAWTAKIMAKYLVGLGVYRPLLITLCAEEFRTVGEINIFWAHVHKNLIDDGCPEYDVQVVDRFWHAFRTERLMWGTLPTRLQGEVYITMVKAPSRQFHKEWLHELGSYVRNARALWRGQVRMLFG